MTEEALFAAAPEMDSPAERQAFLDAALGLLEEQSLSSLGLREVTRAVGVAPTAFYRHFRSTADLGVALVDEALGSLHPMVRTTVSMPGEERIRVSGVWLILSPRYAPNALCTSTMSANFPV